MSRALIPWLLLLTASSGAVAQGVAVPAPLEEWRGWVLQGEDYRQCPWLATAGTAPAGRESRRCAWPGRLVLDLDAGGGRFQQRWEVFAESWVPLPGSVEHWPGGVTIDGRPGAIVSREGIPYARLSAGEHAIAGAFVWERRPESLAVPAAIGLIDLTVDGRTTNSPPRNEGAIFLGTQQGLRVDERFDVQVHRLLVDDMPARLVTQITLRVTGASREIALGPILPAGFIPIALDSPLPARVDDALLRLQLRPGVFNVVLTARATAGIDRVARPVAGAGWPREEIWSFESNDRLRVVAIEGAEGIDPAEAGVPDPWRSFPAWRVLPDTVLEVVERTRGLANADDNRLSLERGLWLDFDHKGFTAVDRITGTMRTGWRLDMNAPYRLGSAQNAGTSLLVTQGANDSLTGIELRTPALSLEAVARVAPPGGALPATGWASRFDNVRGVLHVPPGHRLVAAIGVDAAPGAWLERWGLWNLFGVVIIAVFAGWLGGPLVGALAFAALALTYQDSPQTIWLWANLLAAIAIARTAPTGRLREFATRYRVVSFAALALALVPFMWGQLQLAIYPQLDAGDARAWSVALPASPPPPMMEAASASDSAAREIVVTAAKRAPEPDRYSPGTIVQAGPGIPSWQYRSYEYFWSGPVEPAQTARFVIARPFALTLWRIVGVALLAALFAWLVWGRARTLSMVLFVVATLGANVSQAQSTAPGAFPDANLLNELKTRLTQPPACEPTCADLLDARITASEDRVELVIEASALTTLAVPVPTSPQAWAIESVSVDGDASVALRRAGDDSLWVPLRAGVHTIRVTGRVAGASSLSFVFPYVPRRVSVKAAGWEIAGLSAGRLQGGALELTRRRDEARVRTDSAPEFPPFVRVIRRFDIGLDYGVVTRVERIAPARAAFTVAIPLVAGESVLTDAIEVRNGIALAAFGAGQPATEWRSSLPREETLDLVAAPADARFVEVWQFVVHSQWHPQFMGFPATAPSTFDPAEWLFEFYPRPGETLSARFTKPAPVPGSSLAIDGVERTLSIGKRATDTVLTINYRATQGGRHSVKLPPDARVTGVSVDGENLALRPENGELSLPIIPGVHTISIATTRPQGTGTIDRPAEVDLGIPAANVRTTMSVPANRWVLFATGPGVGPAILYWSELVAFLLTAWFVGRSTLSPLRTHEWVLLGLGLSTLSWGVLALVAFWIFAVRWRAGWKGDLPRWQFNAVQILFAVLTAVAVAALLFAGIRDGLLSTPDMGIVGPGSEGSRFSWFLDRTEGAMPRPTLISLPLWVFKTLVFAWAVWAAFAVLRWLRSAWEAWKSGGYWRSAESTAAGGAA